MKLQTSPRLFWLALLLVAPGASSFSVPPSSSPLGTRRVTRTSIKAATTPLSTAGKKLLPDQKEEEFTWITNLDYDLFAWDVQNLCKRLDDAQNQDDAKHLQKIVAWRNSFALAGIVTMWMIPNPLTILALSTWTYASWTMISHHTCHGGYNRVDAGKFFKSSKFARGSLLRRLVDWCDWVSPEAWNIEHNRLHHYHLGEPKDPDLVQRNLGFLRNLRVPMPLKYAVVAIFMPIWKWFYYAPNTYKELKLSQLQRDGKEPPSEMMPQEALSLASMTLSPRRRHRIAGDFVGRFEVLTKVLGPFLVSRFLLLPAPLLLLPQVGPRLFRNAIINLVAADMLTNIHAFLTIVTNHAGDDVYTFDDEVRPHSGSFYVRQVVGSVNYGHGNDVVDFWHGFLNYQIEHHVWPSLSMLQVQKAAPQLKAICEKHGVPYIQQSVWTRLRKTIDIMVGKTSMKSFPTHLEPSKDKVG